MSLQPLTEPVNRWTLYERLFNLHYSNASALNQENLDRLPEKFREVIFFNIWEQAGRPDIPNYGKLHVFESEDRLKNAVNKAALAVLGSFNQRIQDEIFVEIWKYCGRSITQDSQWGKHYAPNNIPLLLQVMQRVLGELTPELQTILDEWVKQAADGEDRATAQLRIIHFLRDKQADTLNLKGLGLRSLPEIFDKEPFISRLIKLDCSKNKLTSLPETIGNLKNLQELYFNKNQLANLPKAIAGLQKLSMLTLYKNLLVGGMPEAICELQNLQFLDLSENQLATLPENIVCLGALTFLDLSSNQFITIHSQIGKLQTLFDLNLSNNPNLASLPVDLFCLSRPSRVHLEGTRISQHNISTLEEEARNTGIGRGPQFLFSESSIQRDLNRGQTKSLHTLIQELFSVLGEESKSFPELEKLDPDNLLLLRTWLSRLPDTADYRNNKKDYGTQGEFQKDLTRQILDYLQQANDNPLFRTTFFDIIKEALGACGDRISFSILHVGIAFRLKQITNVAELKKFLIETVWPLEMLENFAREKIHRLSLTRDPDSIDQIEVYLAYPIMLQEKLDLDIPTKKMRFFRCSDLTSKELNDAAEYVSNQQINATAVCAFLSNQDSWKKALEARYPDEYNHAVAKNYKELDTVDEAQAKVNRNKRWEALTTKLLREIGQGACADKNTEKND